ncbi:vacuolar protein sorting-associated protein 35 [Suhomyces tanzawaensis NRRL Y-17324]|uniref:Vacuolar protein sorting-associated protein 35 n=1 Tax=Suhomyces tanzawaensis NRRL Y-17324 TaxID=984487 RepID=A0A1E4SAW3_9ASCO|nr:vacuolar protein sorting-associated protein 35 [Suhomyces tanzawaensis NRRL Y-17324]ODV76616.1 vacuolar protein sorting-associated protein 35 [Suhomyces tanzawaensis NRRL Y-17324]
MSLQSSINTINQQSGLMKQNLNDNNLLQALKHCLNFLNELRINKLSPKQYYEIYMMVFDSLEVLLNHLAQTTQKKKKKDTPYLADLYELVQYSGNIIPRLYMMIMVGTTYMATPGAPTKEIMKDMIEMCRGVQHPIRGLFLRYYLSQRIKDLLPLDNEEDFNETVHFLVSNFIEMTKLWVRLQHQGHSSERELRYKERKELKILVGSNLVRLSQIIDDYQGGESYSSINYYAENILPTITEQIIQCRDHLAQSYLIDVLIQIFPDDFHFATLPFLLNDVFINLHPLLKKSELVATLIERFVNYHNNEAEMVGKLSLENKPQVDLFPIFWDFYVKLHEMDSELPIDEHSIFLQSFITLSLTYYPDNYQNLDTIYQFATEKLATKESGSEEQDLWFRLLVAPIQHFQSIKTLFKLPFFFEFYHKLTSVQYQKQLSLEIINKLLSDKNEQFSTTEDIDGIFKYLLVLIKDPTEKLDTAKNLGITKTYKVNNGEGIVTQEFLSNQEKICKVIHLIETPTDPFKNISNLMYVRKKYLNKEFKNIIYTYPALIMKILNKLRLIGYYVAELKKQGKDITHQELLITSNFKNLSVIIDELYHYHQEYHSELILKIYLNAASAADQLSQQSLSYELFNQCFVVYEENLILNPSHNNRQINPHDSLGEASVPYQSILLIADKLYTLRNFNKENYENLITKLTLYGSKLLKKQDQCRAVYFCAHLWWWCAYLPDEQDNNSRENVDDDFKRILECLQKALRVADSCMDPYLSLKLFIEILNRCLIFNVADDEGNTVIDAKYINGLIDLIRTNIDNLNDEEDPARAFNEEDENNQEARLFRFSREYFQRTLEYIAEEQQADVFEGIVV